MLSLVLVLGLCSASIALIEPEELFAWKQIDYTWPTEQARQEAIQKGTYIQLNNLPLGLERWQDKLFVTVPRWKAGVGATLNYIPLNSNTKSPALTPYPSWEANTLPTNSTTLNNGQIVSTFRVKADVCDRLWLVDTGVDDILGSFKQFAKSTIVIIDLKTDKVLKRYELQQSDMKESSFFANIIVDVEPDNCDNAFAYIPDLGGYGIVVYSLAADDSWRVNHNFFHFDPLQGDLTVGGVNFHWTDGVFGLALSNKRQNGYRTLYFHPLASTKEFAVCTGVLRNKTAATSPNNYYSFKIVGDKGVKSQTSASDLELSSNVLFFSQLQKDGVACWNIRKPLTPENIALVVHDSERLIFTNDIKLDQNEPYLYILSDKLPQYLYRSINPDEVNYRIFRLNTLEAVKNTPCSN
ncbi:protein yellow-related [Holotrichia oblita]|uniref:Protein yellow-related n=1 Tax=Holotrichia oblita TaxID=644536 RepID=A0ACB9T4N7_HOLOL|nr:protein yellow-related [Holotrichia oblita]